MFASDSYQEGPRSLISTVKTDKNLKCPFCQKQRNKVIDTREKNAATGDGSILRRRRECEYCERRFTTHETYAHEIPPEELTFEEMDQSLYIMGTGKLAECLGISVSQADYYVRKSKIPLRYVTRTRDDIPTYRGRIRVFREDDLPLIVSAWKFGASLKRIREKVHTDPEIGKNL